MPVAFLSTNAKTMLKKLSILVAACLAILFLWDTPVLYPLQMLVVFFHEASHAIATILTGGQVKEMVLVREQGGHVVSLGGWPFITLSAGYLGSLGFGVLFYILSESKRYQKWMVMGIGLFILLITLVFVRNWFGFGFSLIAGVLFFIAGRYLADDWNALILKAVGLTSMMYVPHDIYSDTIARSYLVSDARMLAEAYGGTTIMWGMFWLFISFYLIFHVFRWSLLKSDSEKEIGGIHGANRI
ncbi:MAG: M50 family metallopeptidase [Bacteroidetes Order II. Incertae sedis bacterium]|nr:M50 family metallopeptidase [Bacteroidetes Order II. bacterium]